MMEAAQEFFDKIEDFVQQAVMEIQMKGNVKVEEIKILMPKHVADSWIKLANKNSANEKCELLKYKGSDIVSGPFINHVMVYHEYDALKMNKPHVLRIDNAGNATEFFQYLN